MSASRRGMGQGLDALFRNMPSVPVERSGSVSNTSSDKNSSDDRWSPQPVSLPIAALTPGQGQPRRHFDEAALDELAASIRSQGIIQPILVRPCHTETTTIYEIVAGERRWRAAQRAGLTEVPVHVREMSDEDALTAALIENLQREDLNPLEEAQAIQSLRERLPLSQEELAQRLGKSRSAIANTLRLLQLPTPMQEALREGTLTPGHARALLALPERALQDVLFRAVIERQLSVRDAEAAVLYWRKHGMLPSSISVGPSAKNGRAAKPESLKRAILQLRASVAPKATIAGSEKMGRITLPYESAEQLADLLRRLGLEQPVISESVDIRSGEQI